MKQENNKLPTNPPKGMYDFDPEEFRVRKYIYDTWRKVCLSFGYEEYLTPVLENADIYRAKSGEDVGGKELMVFTDRAGRELALRPEMTPSVTRLVSKNYTSLKKPIRYFSIANYFRNEKPQKGRNREFWQLNYDIFGSKSLFADIEVVELALQVMLGFNPPNNSFKIYINNRKLIDEILDLAGVKDNKSEVVRLLDKYEKLNEENFVKYLIENGLNKSQISILQSYISCKNEKELIEKLPKLKTTQGFLEVVKTLKYFKDRDLYEYIAFSPKIIRGFDYYDGVVFESFDTNPKNPRSIFGGGRYNGLSQLFTNNNFDAVGAAAGDETFKIFLEGWGLLDKVKANADRSVYFIPLLNKNYEADISQVACNFRKEGKVAVLGLEEVGVSKALEEANKKNYNYIVLFGEKEKQGGFYELKDMKKGEQTKVML